MATGIMGQRLCFAVDGEPEILQSWH